MLKHLHRTCIGSVAHVYDTVLMATSYCLVRCCRREKVKEMVHFCVGIKGPVALAIVMLASSDPPGELEESVLVVGVSDAPSHPKDTLISG